MKTNQLKAPAHNGDGIRLLSYKRKKGLKRIRGAFHQAFQEDFSYTSVYDKIFWKLNVLLPINIYCDETKLQHLRKQ